MGDNRDNHPNLAEPIIATLVSVIGLYIVNNYYQLVPFLNDDFLLILPILNFSFVVSIFLHASRVLFTSIRYKKAVQLVSNIIFLYLAYQTWILFPFDLTGFWETAMRIFIIVSVFGTLLGTVIDTVKLLLRRD